MKKKHIYIHLLGMLLLSVGCTGKFRESNIDWSGVTDDDPPIDDNDYGIRLGITQQGIYFNYDFGRDKNWSFQLIRSLNADMSSGYMHDGKSSNGGMHNSDYNMQDGWNSTMWTHMYSYIPPQTYQSENVIRGTEPALFGITKVLKVEVTHRVTDYYGPVIYKNFANTRNQYRLDAQKEVYYEFPNELDSVVVSFADYIEKKPESNGFTRFDILLDGQYSSWTKFANSLRIRLTMRISAVGPDEVRTEFRKGLENEFGVFEAEDERVAVSMKSGFTNPLGELNRVWNETYMSATMESILTGHDDPRLKAYFETCTDRVCVGEHRGIHQGACSAHNHYAGLFKLSVDQSMDASLMSSAETWFLRAEAALCGWMLEDEEECYQNEIKASLHQRGIYQMDDYLNSERTTADFIDTQDPENNIPARCLASPKWNPADDKEIKLERIITQKWVALFPEGCEAWTEQHRTEYPRLFPVRFNHSRSGCIDTETMVRRLNFPGTLQTEGRGQYSALVEALGGPDHRGARSRWDTGDSSLN